MTQETLKKLRILIPGAMWLVVLRPLFSSRVSWESFTEFSATTGVLNLTAAVLLGGLYYILDARRFAWRSSLLKINTNIKDKLLKACPAISKDDSEKLRKGRTLMIEFYRLIDADSNLEEKAKRVRFNGIFWSSLADLSTISAASCAVYLAASAITTRFDLLLVAIVLGVLLPISQWVLMPLVTRKHEDLSNEQLETIALHHRKALCDDLRRVANEL